MLEPLRGSHNSPPRGNRTSNSSSNEVWIMARDMEQFSGEWYYLDDIYTFKREADEQREFRKDRGYKARVKNVTEGWAVYYR